MLENIRTMKKIGATIGLLMVALGALYFNSSATGSAPGKTEFIPAAKNLTAAIAEDAKRQTFTVEGQTRSALVFDSSAPVPKPGAPLVFVFHGHGGNSQASARKFHIHSQWPEAVVIYPQGLPAPGKNDPEGLKNGWQKRVGELKDRDLKLFDVMLDWAKRQYKIDATRIYVAGHSNGGSMTYVLWKARSESIAAFAPCASAFGINAIGAKPKPAILLAGEQDAVVPFEVQKWNLGVVLKLNQCELNGSSSGKEITLYKSKVGADVAAYIYPGTHALPDDTGAVITRFFKQHWLQRK
jgi:polyhydroxybutyrate depolymerase